MRRIISKPPANADVLHMIRAFASADFMNHAEISSDKATTAGIAVSLAPPLATRLRPATLQDVPRMQEIINSHAELGRMLFKNLAQLYENLRDFAVMEIDGSESPKVIGCCALTIIWADLAEVRSLAVDDAYRGRGVGRRLVEWTVDEARRLGIRRIMSLTYEQSFFAKSGFVVVDKDTLPLKVWSDCVRCPKRDGCDEIAMIRVLEDVPAIEAPAAAPTPKGVSIPVLEMEED